MLTTRAGEMYADSIDRSPQLRIQHCLLAKGQHARQRVLRRSSLSLGCADSPSDEVAACSLGSRIWSRLCTRWNAGGILLERRPHVSCYFGRGKTQI
jgi:hypothetical protein